MSMGAFRPSVGVAGAGRFGVALAELAARNGHDVVLFTTLEQRRELLHTSRRLPDVIPELPRLSERVTVTGDPELLARSCTLVLLTTSAEAFERVLDAIAPALDGSHQVVHAVHILQSPDLTGASTLIQERTAVRQVGVIAGPTHVNELLADEPNAAEVGSAFPAVIAATRRALASDFVQIYGNDDIQGVQLAAALGQITCCMVGISDGLQLGAAPHATLLTRGLQEAAALGVRLGASERTFSGLAGLGRLVDAVHRGEANYQLGRDIAAAKDIALVVDNAPPDAQVLSVVASVVAYLDKFGGWAPIASALNGVLQGDLAPADAVRTALKNTSPSQSEPAELRRLSGDYVRNTDTGGAR